MKKILLLVLAILVIGGGLFVYLNYSRIERVQTVATLFTGAEQYENFNRMHEFFPSTEMPAATTPFEFGTGETIGLPDSFTYNGNTVDTENFLSETDTVALLVIHNGDIRFERYMLTGGEDVTWLSMSVAKSFISALVGIAVSEGHIDSIEDPITNYVPSLAGSAYDGVAIRDILQMSSGASWNEDYSNPESDINRFARIFALGGSMDEFAATLTRENEPGTFNRYNSTDTQVLGMMLTNATGRSVTDYMIEKLWHPLGATNSAYWLTDSPGMEMVFGGMNATARDYAKLGELYRRGGRLNGEQIVPEEWVTSSVTPNAPHLMPGTDNPASDFPLGYGYQWWVPEGDDGEFSAIGVYNQFIFVNPTNGTVIVKLSAFSDYGIDLEEEHYREIETIELFRAIGDVVTAGQ